MRIQITLTPSESKRLIAWGVKALPSVQNAFRNHRIILAGGTTNAFLLEELLGEKMEKKSTYTLGLIKDGKTGTSVEEGRVHPVVITKGKPEDKAVHWKSFLPDLEVGDVFIKGGNAVDHTGLAAVLAGNNMGGTIGAAWGPIMQRGIKFIIPIGLEKLVPDVRDAVEFLAGHPVDEAIGDKVGLMPVPGAKVITEIGALETLYHVKAKCIAAGGIGGSEGAVVLAVDGEEDEVRNVLVDIISLKGEPQVY
ncbi:MAG TPA: hypothetical protein IAC62_14895 [Candidatus Pelethocola excrementipullorum]|nr:hypothetical protein [Candidatus Pelethocola excrementipullorum]